MDNVSELAARATSYIILLQDALALRPVAPGLAAATVFTLTSEQVPALLARLVQAPLLAAKAQALADSATGLATGDAPVPSTAGGDWQAAFEQHTQRLLAFVQGHLLPAALVPPAPAPTPEAAGPHPYPHTPAQEAQQAHHLPAPAPAPALAPENWRRALRATLYAHPPQRRALAEALSYLPAQVFALREAAVAPAATQAGPTPPTWADYLLLSNDELEQALREGNQAVPFEVIFGHELQEITTRRQAQATPPPLPVGSPAPAPAAAPPPNPDPLAHADSLGLCALALSGGGIRTATFNLGVLQGLAGAGWLPRFDYLSTVSGGGYLGAWLTAWIQREGAQAKVAARLCPTTSPLPQADEVRPIRWLRMYSNYLAPKAGSLSTDAWTIGITWLRNTLLNQLVIALALGAVLALGSAALYGWFLLSWSGDNTGQVASLSLALLVPATVLASMGMRMFRSEPVAHADRWVTAIRWGLSGLALGGAYLASGFLYQGKYEHYGRSFWQFWPAAVVALVCLLVVAWAGRYDKCFYRRPQTIKPSWPEVAKAWFLLGLTSALAALAGWAALTLAWQLLRSLHNRVAIVHATDVLLGPQPTPGTWDCFRPQALLYAAFILGPPLVLEALVLAVVTRMALLGRNFPDERREWWGRMGAVLHRVLVAWVLFASSPLLMRSLARLFASLFGHHMEGLSAALATGGWLAVVGKAVQLAFSARTRAVDTQQATVSWLDQVLSFAPYLFGLGLLVQVQGGVYWVLHYASPSLSGAPDASAAGLAGRSLALGGLLALLAVGLGWRVGVNEFSLHHFYRNRLVRAYLGASRPRFARERSANPFTGFDRDDDVKLWTLRSTPLRPAAGAAATATPPTTPAYDGPYLIINATLNATKVTDLAQQDRQAESFVFTPLYCGFDFARIRALNPSRRPAEFGYRPTEHYAYAKDYGPGVGTAMAISGAAANPNEGYHSSPATAFLLTLFNVRLGWWMGNPRNEITWKKSDPGLGLLYLFKDLVGRSDTSDKYVNLSDGGHFDNMGLYELVRRRCRYIVLGDGEEDHLFTCDGLANAIRRCRVDFGVEITIDVTPITTRPAGYSRAHYAVGTIHYPDDAPGRPTGRLLYLKTSLTNDEPTDVREYAQYNKAFPHQSTGDQFFNEAQFESYRRLGLHVFETLAQRNPLLTDSTADLADIFRQLR